jgi:hypothetical protein
VEILRALSLSSAAEPRQSSPAINGAKDRAKATLARPRSENAVWTSHAAASFVAKLPTTAGKVLKALVASGSEWADGAMVSSQSGIKPKGLGSVIGAARRIAKNLDMPSPIEKESTRIGANGRSLKLRLTSDFMTAYGEAAM